MSFGDPAFERILQTKLTDAIAQEERNLGTGAAKDSLYEYGRRVGAIAGYRRALTLIEESHKQMAGEERSIAAEMAKR